eukprot:TRINITY_DN2360_c1_g2_i2.p1 TRINITY_DN2360_c1_g2~~TRINITY_DN2360_c1_g2_i2.p1  ORF type:complete len:475 (+),score=98.13 TRINITY_DN2360_c1_g2_i2:198-1622(+)
MFAIIIFICLIIVVFLLGVLKAYMKNKNVTTKNVKLLQNSKKDRKQLMNVIESIYENNNKKKLSKFLVGTISEALENYLKDGDVELFEFIAPKIDLSYKFPVTGDTFAHLAMRNNQADIVLELVNNEMDVNIPNKNLEYPLHEPQGLSKANCVSNLLTARGIEINCLTSNGSTPLHRASGMGYYKIVNLLLEHKAQPNILNHRDMSPLAVCLNNWDMYNQETMNHQRLIMQSLIDYGAHYPKFRKGLEDCDSIVKECFITQLINIMDLESEVSLEQACKYKDFFHYPTMTDERLKEYQMDYFHTVSQTEQFDHTDTLLNTLIFKSKKIHPQKTSLSHFCLFSDILPIEWAPNVRLVDHKKIIFHNKGKGTGKVTFHHPNPYVVNNKEKIPEDESNKPWIRFYFTPNEFSISPKKGKVEVTVQAEISENIKKNEIKQETIVVQIETEGNDICNDCYYYLRVHIDNSNKNNNNNNN